MSRTREKRQAAGLCNRCGKGLNVKRKGNGKPYRMCTKCRNYMRKQKSLLRNGKPIADDKAHAFTKTEKRYRIKRTSKVGTIVPCPCPNPIILEFTDGSRDAFHLRDCEEVSP